MWRGNIGAEKPPRRGQHQQGGQLRECLHALSGEPALQGPPCSRTISNSWCHVKGLPPLVGGSTVHQTATDLEFGAILDLLRALTSTPLGAAQVETVRPAVEAEEVSLEQALTIEGTR